MRIKAKELPKVAESSATDGMLDMVYGYGCCKRSKRNW